MKIEIDLNKCQDYNITGIEYLYLWYLVNKRKNEIEGLIGDRVLKNLVDQKFIIITNDRNIVLTKEIRKLFKLNEIEKISNIEKLATEYRNLWRERCKGVKSGGYPVVSNLQEIIAKFIRFHEKYKNEKYTNLEVIESTRMYIDQKERENWQYCKTSKHFIIMKKPQLNEEVSELSTFIDLYREKGSEYNKIEFEKRL